MVYTSSQDKYVGAFVHLKELPNEAGALDTLKQVASLVLPIMRKHDWRISKLAEFYPEQQNLWGLNTSFPGSARLPFIQIRLRHAHNANAFIPYEAVVDTMLHELTHCQFGPHDDKFWNMFHSLQSELDTLKYSGFTGEGFLGKGKQLGATPRGLSQRENIMRARDEAQKRRKLLEGKGRILSSGGFGPLRWSVEEAGPSRRPQGGRYTSMPQPASDQLSPYTTPQQLAAMAALQRNSGTKKTGATKTKASGNTCPDQGCMGVRTASPAEVDRETALVHGFTTVADMEDANELAIIQAAIELLEEAEKEEAQIKKLEGSGHPPGGYSADDDLVMLSSPPPNVTYKPAQTHAPPTEQESFIASNEWQCNTCTLLNPDTHLQCICGDVRPDLDGNGSKSRALGQGTLGKSKSNAVNAIMKTEAPIKTWTCHRCDNIVSHEWWSCTRCGCIKLES